MPFDPNEPRDKYGKWTDATGTGQGLPAHIGGKILSQVQGEVIAVAPLYQQDITTEQEDKKVRDSPEYKNYINNIHTVANGLGINVLNTMDTWGGYVNSETGLPVQEVSNIIHVDGDPKKVELMAAILGKAAPEIQDSVLVGHYDPKGSGTEYTISTGSFDNGVKAINYLKSNNLQYFSVNKANGDVIILDTDNSQEKNIDGFIGDLNKNNIYQQTKFSHVNATFIGKEEYNGTIESKGLYTRTEKGFDINAFVEKAQRSYTKIKEERIRGSQ